LKLTSYLTEHVNIAAFYLIGKPLFRLIQNNGKTTVPNTTQSLANTGRSLIHSHLQV